VVVNNKATDRGFFSGDTSIGFTTLTGSPYTIDSGFFDSTTLTGGTILTIDSGTTASVGDNLLIKLGNSVQGGLTPNSNEVPVPHLWYKIQDISGGTVTVDRKLPNVGDGGSVSLQYLVYPGGEVSDTIGSQSSTSYWDSGTLSFDASCDVSCSDVPVWNMNNVWCEDLAGITGSSYEGHEHFGSYDFLGQKDPYWEYTCSSSTNLDDTLKCEGLSDKDGVKKSIAILHYTNNTISNFYGEFFHIDTDNNKTLKLHLPDIMYHRRYFSGGTGDVMGMSFIASGQTQYVGTSNIEYIPLIEDPSLISSGSTPMVVGKVFPHLKVVVIDDEEIVAALSYKSNRNWTLPQLAAALGNPTGGLSTGLLLPNETMYITYALENEVQQVGLTSSLGCQKYTKISNKTAVPKDVHFRLEDTGLLPYMREIGVGYDGLGFYGQRLKVLYQIVSNDDDRPNPELWKVYDFTPQLPQIPQLPGFPSESISPSFLEEQNPAVNDFILDVVKDSNSVIYDITQKLGMSPILSPETLQFGDERFFYGNVETYIGATIFKTIFDIRINSSQFNKTTNETRSTDPLTNPPNIRVSEVGIYDNNNNLVIIGKLSRPIKLAAGNTIMIELSIDF